MSDQPRLKEKYLPAKCCLPSEGEPIVGYFSFDDLIKVHRADCANLAKAPRERLLELEWADILAEPEFSPDESFFTLETNDFSILDHHDRLGVDYSLKVAADLLLPKQELFERHKHLREMGLIERVEPTMIRYRKGIVDNKWIKHRNHTYYDLTPMGQKFLEYHRKKP